MTKLPVRIDPFLPGLRGRTWSGELAEPDLPRLQSLVAPGTVTRLAVRFTLVTGARGELRFQLVLSGRLTLICQRCLNPMPWEMDLKTDTVVSRSEAEPLASQAGEEVFFLEADGWFYPALAVEEELLLALPLVPRHDACPPVGI